jgi:hypothetical protein
MSWVLEHLQLIIGAAAAIAYVLNQRRQANKSSTESADPKAGDTSEQTERTRRIQEEIRRKIAERRGAENSPTTTRRELIPPLVRPTSVPPIDPFGGPMRRVVRKLEEAAQRMEQQPDDSVREKERAAELARQARLAEQLRELEDQRMLEQRRAAQIAARNSAEAAKAANSRDSNQELRELLKDPRNVRRAFVMREILGPPVSARR